MSSARQEGSPRLRAVRKLWELFEHEGFGPAGQWLLAHSEEDLELRPWSASGETLRGREAVRSFFDRSEASGTLVSGRAYTFVEHGEEVRVSGWVRVRREQSGLQDSQLTWVHRFRGDRLVSILAMPLELG